MKVGAPKAALVVKLVVKLQQISKGVIKKDMIRAKIGKRGLCNRCQCIIFME